jgi:predicted phosphodiesterase
VRLALISDIHANLTALDATLADIATQAVDRIVCLGDIVGYNAHPAECVQRMRRRRAQHCRQSRPCRL